MVHFNGLNQYTTQITYFSKSPGQSSKDCRMNFLTLSHRVKFEFKKQYKTGVPITPRAINCHDFPLRVIPFTNLQFTSFSIFAENGVISERYICSVRYQSLLGFFRFPRNAFEIVKVNHLQQYWISKVVFTWNWRLNSG